MVKANDIYLSLDLRFMISAIYDLCPQGAITRGVKKMMLHLANASQDNFLEANTNGPLLCLLVALLLYCPVFVFTSVSLAKWWAPLRVKSNLALFSIFWDFWFIGVRRMLFSINGGENKIILVRYLKKVTLYRNRRKFS